MTIAQQLRQEGIQQGGHDKAFEIAKNLLSSSVDKKIVRNSTGLSDKDISRLRLH